MKTVPQNTTLVKELLRQLNECQRAFSQERVFVRGVMLALGEALTFGQHHMTDVLRAVRLTEED
ncbi:MAG: hypothetical protein JNL42_17500, partial [Anaerolineae bacterium]|nr:hypothetical protein [Anaerolineae bacterium]